MIFVPHITELGFTVSELGELLKNKRLNFQIISHSITIIKKNSVVEKRA